MNDISHKKIYISNTLLCMKFNKIAIIRSN